METKSLAVPQLSQSMDRWIDEKEASRITGMSRAWFQRKRWEGGGIPYTKIDRACRYKVSDVVWFMENRKTTSTSNNRVPDSRLSLQPRMAKLGTCGGANG